MGRKPVEKTEEEKAAQRKAWQEARNIRRAAEYSSNPEYRDTVVRQSRATYRAKNDVQKRMDCRTNAAVLGSIGSLRQVELPGLPTITTFDTKELGTALGGYTDKNIYKWFDNGLLPRPVVDICGWAGARKVYVLDEVAAILPILGAHQQEVNYYRREHTTIIDAIFTAVQDVRRANGLG